MTQLLQVSTTTETKTDAEKIIEGLLEKKLIACGQISGPIASHYRWQGQLTKSEEFVVTMKTVPRLEKILMKELTKLHPYDLPEIMGVTIDKPSTAYLDWVEDEVRK